MGINWIDGAERLGDGSIGGEMDTPNLPPRVVWHTTESGQGDAAFNAVGRYLISKSAEPHILYDPTTDRIAQYGPLNESARALRNDGATRTNRTGKVCIQIEVLGRAAEPFTKYWRPGPNFRRLMAAIRSWGVPDEFPLPLASRYNAGVRTRATWLNEGGHYGHCNVPGNDHWDPGNLDIDKLFAAAGEEAKPSKPKPVPTVDLSRLVAAARRDPSANGTPVTYSGVRIVERALVAERLLNRDYADGHYGTATVRAYASWQRRCGYIGRDADGIPGATTLRKLGSEHGFKVVS